MKEASGELNMTVITVVAIAAVGLLFTLFVWPNIQANLMLSTACSNMNSNGDYVANQTANNAANADEEGTITCEDWVCTATYNGKTYERNCSNAGA